MSDAAGVKDLEEHCRRLEAQLRQNNAFLRCWAPDGPENKPAARQFAILLAENQVVLGDLRPEDAMPSPAPNRDASALTPDTDDADPVTVLRALGRCALAWEPGARLLGNIRGSDILRACGAAMEVLAPLPNVPKSAMRQRKP